MAEHAAEIAAIAGSNAPPSFASTIEALERSGRLLGRVHAVYSANLVSSHGGEALQAIEREMAPRYARHMSQIHLNGELFGRDMHLGQGPRPTRASTRRSGGCWSAPISAPCAAARLWGLDRRRAWRRSRGGSPRSTPRSARTYCTTRRNGSLSSATPISRACPISSLPGAAGGRRARTDERLGGNAVALADRAVSVVQPAPRSAPDRACRLDRARRTPGRARQPGADSRNPGIAGRAGTAAGLRDLRRFSAGRHDGRHNRMPSGG